MSLFLLVPMCVRKCLKGCIFVWSGGRGVPGAALPGAHGAAAIADVGQPQQDLPAGRHQGRAHLPLLQAFHARPRLRGAAHALSQQRLLNVVEYSPTSDLLDVVDRL